MDRTRSPRCHAGIIVVSVFVLGCLSVQLMIAYLSCYYIDLAAFSKQWLFLHIKFLIGSHFWYQ